VADFYCQFAGSQHPLSLIYDDLNFKNIKNSMLKVKGGLKLLKIAFLFNFFDKKNSILCVLLCHGILSLIKQFLNFSVAKVYPAHFDLIGTAHMCRRQFSVT
jgi:hypothetical protein